MSELVTCKILSLAAHPQATKLKVCQVTDGKNNFSVVCGAQNVRTGMITVLAQPGSTTPHGLNIQRSNIRGVDSDGMLCSPIELNISQEQGIVDLAPETALGLPFTKFSAAELSSTPWWKYQLLERFVLDEKTKKITVLRNDRLKNVPTNSQLVSETYFFEGNLHYRRF